MVNQAALKAANDGQTLVNMNHLNFAKDKILMGVYPLSLCRFLFFTIHHFLLKYGGIKWLFVGNLFL